MAATPATVVDFKRVNDFKIFRYSALTIDAGGNRQLSIAIPRRGTFEGICVTVATSLDFNVQVAQKVDVAIPDKDILYRVETVTSKMLRVTDLGIPYYNNDTTPVDKLYVTIENDDGVNATGAIAIEVIQLSKGGAE